MGVTKRNLNFAKDYAADLERLSDAVQNQVPIDTDKPVEPQLQKAIDLFWEGQKPPIKDFQEALKDKMLFNLAGGKDLVKDRQTTAKEVTKSPQRYIKVGAKRIDLRGVDTKQVLAKGKNENTELATEVKFKRRGKEVTLVVNKKGQFVKRIK